MDLCTDNIQARRNCRKEFLWQPKEHRCNFAKTSPCHRACSGWSLRLRRPLLEGNSLKYQHWTSEVEEQDTTFLFSRERLTQKQWDSDRSKTFSTVTSFGQRQIMSPRCLKNMWLIWWCKVCEHTKNSWCSKQLLRRLYIYSYYDVLNIWHPFSCLYLKSLFSYCCILTEINSYFMFLCVFFSCHIIIKAGIFFSQKNKND